MPVQRTTNKGPTSRRRDSPVTHSSYETQYRGKVAKSPKTRREHIAPGVGFRSTGAAAGRNGAGCIARGLYGAVGRAERGKTRNKGPKLSFLEAK